MRIARNWDIAYIDRPLVAFRVHDQTETARLAPRGQDEDDARNRLLTYGRIMFDRRMGFLDEAGLPRARPAIPIACEPALTSPTEPGSALLG